MQNLGVYWTINVNYGALLFSVQSRGAVWVGEGVGSFGLLTIIGWTKMAICWENGFFRSKFLSVK